MTTIVQKSLFHRLPRLKKRQPAPQTTREQPKRAERVENPAPLAAGDLFVLGRDENRVQYQRVGVMWCGNDEYWLIMPVTEGVSKDRIVVSPDDLVRAK